MRTRKRAFAARWDPVSSSFWPLWVFSPATPPTLWRCLPHFRTPVPARVASGCLPELHRHCPHWSCPVRCCCCCYCDGGGCCCCCCSCDDGYRPAVGTGPDIHRVRGRQSSAVATFAAAFGVIAAVAASRAGLRSDCLD